tara:strand:+ start:888 stop:1130 length:243 start_codon:yes stop_codon:yes gene_type:complete
MKIYSSTRISKKSIAENLQVLKADRAEILKTYPDLDQWETADDEMAAWINHEYLAGQIHALESILGMKLTFGNEGSNDYF